MQSTGTANNTNNKLLRSKMFWIGILYFAEGFPLGIFYDIFPVYFRQQGVELSEIGFISLLGLAWTMKFLWAPAVDHYRHHRRWMAGVDLAMGSVMLLFAIQAGFGPWVWFAIGAFTLFSATNDIAIDGYTIEMLNRNELGLANGLRIGFYRVGMLAAGFILILSDSIGWPGTYLCSALLFIVLALACLAAPREHDIRHRHQLTLRSELKNLLTHPYAFATVLGFLLGALWLFNRTTRWSEQFDHFWESVFAAALLILLFSVLRRYQANRGTPASEVESLSRGPMFGALLEMLQRPYMVPIIIFILIFKLGDSAMGFMVKPFWVDAGFSASQIGLVSVNLGLALSIIGGIAGGWFTDRVGIFRSLWVLGLFQAVSNLGYAWAAALLPTGVTPEIIPMEHIVLIYSASGLESFTGGLGTAAFLAFLMAIVDKQHSATEYALLSSVFALSRSLAGWASGFGAEAMGYSDYFLLTFFLAFPAYLLLPWVRRMINHTETQNSS